MSDIETAFERFLTVQAPVYGARIAMALVLAVVGLLIAGWVGGGVRRMSERSARIDPTLVPFLTKLARWSVLAVTLVAVLDKFGVETTSVIAFLGAAGLAIGLALKDTLGDVAAGIALLILRPFRVGDAVSIGGTLGTVEAIDLFETRLITFDGVPVIMPNGNVRSALVQNYSQAARRRIDLSIGVGYGSDLGVATAALLDVAAKEPRVLADPEPYVRVQNLGESSVDILFRVWTLPADFFDTKLDLTRAIKERLDVEGVEIPFPQRDLHVIERKSAA